jgi:DNA-binding MarR family transcriptional regulator
MISTPETLELICQLVLSKTGTSLNEAQRLLLGEIWEHPNKTYDQIATDLGYSSNYIKKTICSSIMEITQFSLGGKSAKKTI